MRMFDPYDDVRRSIEDAWRSYRVTGDPSFAMLAMRLERFEKRNRPSPNGEAA